MGVANYFVGGSSIVAVDREAGQLAQSFLGVVECPQERFPELAGRRLFWVKYGDIDTEDVEDIRQRLGRGLNSQAWSITPNADGTHTWYPERRGPDELPARRSERDDDDPPPPYHEFSGDSSASESDDEDWDWDWGYPEPPPFRGRRRHTFADDYDRNDMYEHDPEPPPFRSNRRNTFANDYDLSDMYEDYPEPPFHRGRRRNSYTTDHYREDTFRDYAELPPFHGRRRNSHASGFDRDARSWNYQELPRFSEAPRSTYTGGYDRGNRNSRVLVPPRHRGPPYASNGSRRHGNWEGFAPPGVYLTGNRHGRDRYRDALVPSWNIDPAWARNSPWGNYPLVRRNFGRRPRSSKIVRFFRAFLNYVTS